MKKGFTTLLTVAIALVSVQAMANAPVIGDIPSPVVGSTISSTQPTAFVFQDAFDLESYASDDVSAQNALKWTYEVVGTSKYLINGVQPINSASTDPSSPTLAQTINKTVAGGELNGDTKANTITVRNQRLAPLGGTALATPAAGFYDTQAVTFWCSDGSAASSHTVFFYTQSGVASYLSSKNAWKTEKTDDALATGFDHSWQIFTGKFGNITTATWSGGVGICFNTALSGDNFSDMAPVNSYFTLTANTVYRARFTMNCSQTAPGHTPFWDMIIENWPATASASNLNLYGADNYYIDNENGANAVVSSTAGTEISMYWAPAPVQCSHWTSSLFVAANANSKDARMRFRVMDADSNAPLLNNQKFGLICMTKLTIESVPFSHVQLGTSKVNVTNFKQSTATGGGTVDVSSVLNGIGLNGTTIGFNGDGTLTLTPANSGTQNEIVTIVPQVTKAALGTGRTNNDGDYPIAWVDDKTYIMQVDVSAPDTTGQSHPWDVIWLNMEPPTNEVIGESYITSNQGYGSPQTGTPQTYTLFYNALKATHSTQADYKFLRWRVRFGNSTALNFPTSADTTNTGAVKVHNVRVNEFSVQ